MAHPYGAAYRRRRKALIGEPCVWCGRPADTADHVPPLAAFPPGEWVGELHPACKRCNYGRRADRADRRQQRGDARRPALPRRRLDLR